jgi:hypothetical protein
MYRIRKSASLAEPGYGAPFLAHRTKCPLALIGPFIPIYDPGTYGAVSHSSLHDPSLG